MSKRETFYNSLSYEGDKLILPSDETERKEFARSRFGAMMVACVDILVEAAHKIVAENSEFLGFTLEQRAKVRSLASSTAYGALYWQCVKMDHFNDPALEINLIEHDETGKDIRSTPIAGPAQSELHHEYFEWVERFGDHYEDGTRFSLGSNWLEESASATQSAKELQQAEALYEISDEVMSILHSRLLKEETVSASTVRNWLHGIYNSAQVGLRQPQHFMNDDSQAR